MYFRYHQKGEQKRRELIKKRDIFTDELNILIGHRVV